MPSKENFMKNTFQSVAGYKLLSAIIQTFQNYGGKLSLEQLYAYLPQQLGYELNEDERGQVASVLDGYTMGERPYDEQDGKVLYLFEDLGNDSYVLTASEETINALQMEDGAFVAPEDIPTGALNGAQASKAWSDREEFASSAGHDTLTSSYETSQESTSSDGMQEGPQTVIVAFVGQPEDFASDEELEAASREADAYEENPYDEESLEQERALRDAHFAWQQGKMEESDAILEEEYMDKASHGFIASSELEGKAESGMSRGMEPEESDLAAKLAQAQATIASLKEQLYQSDQELRETTDRYEGVQADARSCFADRIESEGSARDHAASAREAREAMEKALAEKESMKKESIQAHSDAMQARSEAEAARAEAEVARSEASQAADQVIAANARVENANYLIAQARDEAESARQDARDARAEVTQIRADAKLAQTRIDEAQAQNEVYQQKAIDAQNAAAQAQGKLDVIADADRADKAAKKLTRKLNRAEDRIAQQYRKIDDHQQQIDDGKMRSFHEAQIRHNEKVIDRKERKIAELLADAQAACDRQYLARSIR